LEESKKRGITLKHLKMLNDKLIYNILFYYLIFNKRKNYCRKIMFNDRWMSICVLKNGCVQAITLLYIEVDIKFVVTSWILEFN